MMRFSNKVAWISGAGGYIGGTTARMLAAEGAAVAVCDINEACVEKTVSAIVGAGGKAVGIVCDITNSASVDAAVQKAVETFGRLDIMVHVAGGSARDRMKELIQQSNDVIQDIIGVNLFGGIWASRAAAQQLVKEGHGGRIINISSIVAMEGLKGCVDYAASKGGLIAMSRSLAKELASYGITVNTVAPGVVQRPDSHDENYSLNTNFLHIKCEATDIANMVLFLASDEARFITGQTYVVDGGRSLAMKGSDV